MRRRGEDRLDDRHPPNLHARPVTLRARRYQTRSATRSTNSPKRRGTMVRLGPQRQRGRVAPRSDVPGRTIAQATRCRSDRAKASDHSEDTRGTLGLFDGLLGLLSHDVGIDLGTANTLVTVRNRGIVISEPSVVAMDTRTKRVLAIGAEAKRMVGRTPANIVAIRPLRDGVISDFDVTEQMIRYFINKVHDRYARIPRPRVLVGIPSGVTEVEKRAVRDATVNAGARWARLIEEPMAAAIGAGLPVSEPSGSLIVDIGGGTTEVAVISLGGIVVSRSIRIGGDEMDTDIVSFARREYNLLMGERTAEEIKIAVGSAYPSETGDERTVTFRGRDLLTGLPRSVEVGGDQIREALEPSIAADRRRHQGDDRGDAARAGGRHHGPGDRAGRWRSAARRARPPRRRGDPDAGPHRRRSRLPASCAAPAACSRTSTRSSASWSASSSPAPRADARATDVRADQPAPPQPGRALVRGVHDRQPADAAGQLDRAGADPPARDDARARPGARRR